MSSPLLSSEKNYEVLRTLGEGGFSQILEVKFHSDEKLYAIKEFHLSKLPKEERPAALYETINEFIAKSSPTFIEA